MKIRRQICWYLFVSSVLSIGAAARPARADGGAAEVDGAAGPECGTENLLAGKLPWQQHELRGDSAAVTDGVVGAEGAPWEASFAVQLDTRASFLTYDLGGARSVSGFLLQADANDSYTISGSVDGAAGSYRPIAEAVNVVDRGHGLRTRLIVEAPATVRYLRVGDSNGDGAYSISEFAAYCRAPSSPPQLRIAGDTRPPKSAPKEQSPGPKPKPSAIGGLQIALGLLILVLVAAAPVRRREDGAAASPGDRSAKREDSSSRPERLYPLVLLLFVGSGAAALIYEIVWFQMLQLVLGSSAFSIGVLLGTFMGGMCIGSLALARYVPPSRHPLHVYAILETAIAVCGLLMLVAMPLVQSVYTSVVGHGVPGLFLRALFAGICLLPPTVMMGATLPAVARWVETTPRGVSWLGSFYAANTLGAVGGCVLAGFYLLRVHDMPIATFVAVGLNVVVAGIAIRLARYEPRTIARPDSSSAPLPAPMGGPWGRRAVYLTIALSGMSALGAEVIWTRQFTLLLSGNTYTFSIILAVFLVGIGLGSGVGSYLAERIASPRRALGVTQVLLIFAVGWTSWNITSSMPFWPVNPTITSSPWYQFQIDFLRSLWAILPAACLWGASFPLALAAVATEGEDGGRMVGRIYAANTVGAIIGALVTSLALIAWIGTQESERLLVGLSAVAAIACFVRLGGGDKAADRLSMREVIPVLISIEIASIVGRNIAPVPAVLIGQGRMSAVNLRSDEKYIYVGEGMNSSLAVSRNPGGVMKYHNAGKVQASSFPQDMRLQRMLGHLTTLLPEHPRSVLVVACGAGVTAGAASVDPRVEHLVIAEIEPLVPEVVAKYFGKHNFEVVQNPKVRIEVDDARHFLNTTHEKFDAITSDPFDPWVKGAASLYTKEFWQLARRHLNPGGVVTVFVQLYDSGMEAVKSEVATFFEVFPDGIVWGNTSRGAGYDVVLSGQVDPRPIDLSRMETLIASPEFAVVAKSLREIGFNSATALFSTYAGRGPELQPWLTDAQINRDNNLRLQFLAGLGMNIDQRSEIYQGILKYRRYPEDLFVGSAERLQVLRTGIFGKQQ
jgi:spermidine synthase